MASVPIKMNKGLHEQVKEFVDDSDDYSSYKSFYEDAVRRILKEEKFRERDLSQEEIETIREALNQS
jgi:Arc/MetJ-type ribon-helix-helix transcriptional regulator